MSENINNYDFESIEDFLSTFDSCKTITDEYVQKMYNLCRLYKTTPNLFNDAEVVLITQMVKQLKIDRIEGETVTIISDFLSSKLKKCGNKIFDKYFEHQKEMILMPSHRDDDNGMEM
ncbi:MAG: hypothetical protein E7378_04470 [Clostridiales bacterium]|nr:hypothetical protein [Clostridiales bacterium]